MSDLVTGLGLHIKVASISASREFYEDYLGLTPVFAYGSAEFLATLPADVANAPENYPGVTYELPGGASFEIAEGHIAVAPEVSQERIASSKVSAMIKVTSLVPLLEKSERRPTFPVRKYYWNSVEMVLRDPDGFVLVLIAPFSEGELEAVRRFVDVEVVEPKGA